LYFLISCKIESLLEISKCLFTTTLFKILQIIVPTSHYNNDGYDKRTCDFHHGIYDIVSTCELNFKFAYSNTLFEFGFYHYGSCNCP
jgi:hypothetical protein